MGTFYSKNDYRNYLAHYGVKGMNRPSGLKYKTRKKTVGAPRSNDENPFHRPHRLPHSSRPSSLRSDADAHQRDDARRQEQNRVHSQLEAYAREAEHMRGDLLKNRIAQLRRDNARRHKVEEEKRYIERRRQSRRTVSNWGSNGYERRARS
jgi:hypothetical protein